MLKNILKLNELRTDEMKNGNNCLIINWLLFEAKFKRLPVHHDTVFIHCVAQQARRGCKASLAKIFAGASEAPPIFRLADANLFFHHTVVFKFKNTSCGDGKSACTQPPPAAAARFW